MRILIERNEKHMKIAILGFGVVGSGTAEVITENQKLLAKHCGEEVEIKYILDLREFPDHPLGDRVVHDVNIIMNDPEIVLVAEMMGGSHPAYDFTVAALKAGKHVVTSNKEVVATFGVELLKLAGVDLTKKDAFEACMTSFENALKEFEALD